MQWSRPDGAAEQSAALERAAGELVPASKNCNDTVRLLG